MCTLVDLLYQEQQKMAIQTKIFFQINVLQPWLTLRAGVIEAVCCKRVLCRERARTLFPKTAMDMAGIISEGKAPLFSLTKILKSTPMFTKILFWKVVWFRGLKSILQEEGLFFSRIDRQQLLSWILKQGYVTLKLVKSTTRFGAIFSKGSNHHQTWDSSKAVLLGE